ncbi:MAG: hypothetical protein V2I33_24490 [Kangiellaceae bacterium]|jgi:primosomal protein N''|nr:hypothetical protein [Kangiellaceae bacterium]
MAKASKGNTGYVKDKALVIAPSQAVVNPDAVMVEAQSSLSADRTVMRAGWTAQLTFWTDALAVQAPVITHDCPTINIRRCEEAPEPHEAKHNIQQIPAFDIVPWV